MAIILTKEYKKIGQIVLQDSTYDNILYIYGKAEEPDAEDKQTKALFKVTYYRSDGSVTFDSATANLDGTIKKFGRTTIPSGETVLFEDEEKIIKHNSNGTSKTKSVYFSWDATYGGDGKITIEVEAQDIPLIAVSDINNNSARLYVTKFDQKGLDIVGGGWDLTDDPEINSWKYIEGSPLDKIFNEFEPSKTYYLRTYIVTSAGGVNSEWIAVTTGSGNAIRIKVNGVWKIATPFVKINGVWKKATPYIKVSGVWKKGG